MCKYYCMSNGPSTDLKCLHCSAGYCGACLHGEGGKMVSSIKCSTCGKKPRTKSITQIKWKGQNHIAADVKLGVYDTHNLKNLRPGLHADTQNPKSENLKKSESLKKQFAGASAGGAAAAAGSSSDANFNRSSSRSGSRSGSRLNGSVFSRLTNPKGFPGTHKHRFDSNGKGLGLAGRDYCPKGTFGVPDNALQIYERAGKQSY